MYIANQVRKCVEVSRAPDLCRQRSIGDADIQFFKAHDDSIVGIVPLGKMHSDDFHC